MKKTSFCSWAFALGPYSMHPVSFEQAARRVAEAGYQAIEIAAVEHQVTLANCPSPESRAAVRDLLKNLNLEPSAYICDQYDCDPTEEGSRERYLDKFQRQVELCHDLGIGNIRIDSVAAPEKFAQPEAQAEAAARTAEVFEAAAEAARQASIRLHWEFEPGFLFNKPSEIIDLVNRVQHSNFGVLFDTTNACLCSVFGARQQGEKEALDGGAGELLTGLGPRVTALHLGDSDGTLYGNIAGVHAPFGTGFVDLPALAPQLAALDAVDHWTVDSSFWPGAWELAHAQLKYLQKLQPAS